MLYGIFNDKAGGGTVGDLTSSGGLALRSGTNPGDGQGRKDLAVAAGCEKAP